MKLIGKSLMFGFCAATIAVAACSTAPHQAPSTTTAGNAGGGAATSPDSTGALGMQLTLPGGEHITTVTYTLANAAHSYTGSYNVSGTTSLSFVIGSVAAGTGYSLSLTATTDDGTVTCAFPAAGHTMASNPTEYNNITVVNRTTTVVNINLQCVNNQGLDSGSVLVNAAESNCPVWNTIVGNPLNVTLDAGQNVNDSGTAGSTAFYMGASPAPAQINDGQSLVLVGSATGPNPGALAFNWTVSPAGATLSSPTGMVDLNSTDAGTTNQTIFTCPTSGQTTFTVTLTMSDGPLPDGGTCDPKFTTGQLTVVCNSPSPCAASGGIVAVPNTSAGMCPTALPAPTVLASGADGAGNWCCIPPPACPTGPFANPFPGGTCGAGLLNSGGCCQALSPCTTSLSNCAQCSGNTSGLCSTEEAYFVSKDITNGKVTAPGPIAITSATSSCYSCLVNNSAVDGNGTTGVECDDLTGNFVNGGGTTVPAKSTCQTLIQCLTGTKGAQCARGNAGVGNDTFCYCGTGGYNASTPNGPAACQAASSGALNGNCLAEELAGFASTTPATNFSAYASSALPSGMANQMVESARDTATKTKCSALCGM